MMTPRKSLGMGSIIWWSLPEDIPVKRSAWGQFEPDPDFAVPAEAAGDILRRALYRIPAPSGARRLVRPLPHKGDWALVIETPRPDDLSYSTSFTVALNPALGAQDQFAYIREPDDPDMAHNLELSYQAEAERIAPGAVADLVLGVVRGQCLAVAARKSGGVYFVPQERYADLDRVSKLVERLGGALFRFPVHDTEQTRDSLLRMVIQDLRTSAETVRGNLEARHKADAVMEARNALDRLAYYKDALSLAAEQAAALTSDLNDLLVEALTDKRKKTTEGE